MTTVDLPEVRARIETYSGVMYNYIHPEANMIRLDDIVHALANICRFGGHTKRFYSVAEHALLVRHIVLKRFGPELELAALHHDSHEAYIGDLPTPLKKLLGDTYREIVHRADDAVSEALGINRADLEREEIYWADQKALWLEIQHLKVDIDQYVREWPEGVEDDDIEVPWDLGFTPGSVEMWFLMAHHSLVG